MNTLELGYVIMCLQEINYVMRYEVIKSDVHFAQHLIKMSVKNYFNLDKPGLVSSLIALRWVKEMVNIKIKVKFFIN